jgi:hypothetical protein
VQAHRVLVVGGYLWIAEVRSRLEKGEGGDDNDVTQALIKALKVRVRLRGRELFDLIGAQFVIKSSFNSAAPVRSRPSRR